MNTYYSAAVGAQAEIFDIAVVPIDQYGTVGNLNAKIIESYGYELSILSKLELSKGYDYVAEEKKKALLFVVTISNKVKTDNLIKRNLERALFGLSKLEEKYQVWLPLLGTGVGNLSYEQSWSTISSVLDGLSPVLSDSTITITVAVPDDSDGNKLYKFIQAQSHTEISLELDILLQNSKEKFYLVESSYEGEDHGDLFYMGNIWNTAYDLKYADKINSIEVGDFLIQKSTFLKKNGGQMLRFKGIGKVTGNPRNGTSLNVNWIISGQKFDISGMRNHTKAISEPSKTTIRRLFEGIPLKFAKEILKSLESSLDKEKFHHFAGLVSDSYTGNDYLDIMPDVNAFALVLASKSFQPPLAAALLGKWGSGKSFFMNKLKNRIEELSRENSTHFCEGIVHVHFNAWSYMDANLWASVTNNIFEELNDYITRDDKALRSRKEVEMKMTEDLSATKEEIAILEHKKLEIDGQLEELNRKKGKIKNELDHRIRKLGMKSLLQAYDEVDKEFKLEEKITEAVKNNPGVKKDIDHFRTIVPEEYWKKPDELYVQAKRLPVIVRLFATGENAAFNLWWLAGIIAVLIMIPLAIEIFTDFFKYHVVSLVSRVWIIIAPIGAFYVQAAKIYKRYQPFLGSMWKIKEDYLREQQTALENFEQSEKALIEEIDYKKNELEQVNSQITSVKVVRSTLEFKKNNALSTAALHDFIEKRCSSDDYKKHLGLISVVRKDFQALSALITGHGEEFKRAGKSKEFRELFDKPVERIVLYIDDLDRCPEDRVIEVLEAVNLLMAFPLFVVVVGVDPRWVKNALTVKYKSQFIQDDDNYKCMEPSDYLEKIFQIAFKLKTAEDSSIKVMLRQLSSVDDLQVESEDFEHSEPAGEAERDTPAPIIRRRKNINLPRMEEKRISKETIVKSLSFSDEELKCIEDMSNVLGSNPRLIKRFINIYRIIKSHEYISTLQLNSVDMKCILLLLALLLSRFRIVLFTIFDEVASSRVNATLSSALSFDFVDSEDDRIKQMKIELKGVLKESNEELLKTKIADLKKHSQFIERFSF